jgi:hypothetical protein
MRLPDPERIRAVGLRELGGTDSDNTGADWSISREWAGYLLKKERIAAAVLPITHVMSKASIAS